LDKDEKKSEEILHEQNEEEDYESDDSQDQEIKKSSSSSSKDESERPVARNTKPADLPDKIMKYTFKVYKPLIPQVTFQKPSDSNATDRTYAQPIFESNNEEVFF